MSKFKKLLYLTLANIFLFFLIEIAFTFFFIFHSTNYHGPLARLFLSEKKVTEKTVLYNLMFSKKTGMYVPGEYNLDNVKHRVNKFGFIGEEVSVQNQSGCRVVALGGSTTAGTETNKPYPKILENLLLTISVATALVIKESYIVEFLLLIIETTLGLNFETSFTKIFSRKFSALLEKPKLSTSQLN